MKDELQEALDKLQKELEKSYRRYDIVYMHPDDWDDIYSFNKSWQEIIRNIIDEEND